MNGCSWTIGEVLESSVPYMGVHDDNGSGLTGNDYFIGMLGDRIAQLILR